MPAPSLHFLAAHHLFSAAVVAFQNTPKAEHTAPPVQDVAEAFEAATRGLEPKERVALVEYLARLLHLPGKVSNERTDRRRDANMLDAAIEANLEAMRRDDTLITRAELLERTGMFDEALALMLKKHRIFKLPRIRNVDFEGDPDYFPAFYAGEGIILHLAGTVSAAMRALDGLRKFRFFITPEPRLENRTPLDVINNSPDKFKVVMECARAFHKEFGKAATSKK
ncbi:MAG: hypothetical protein V4582_23055 [Pseudomonadota bacterium]